MLKTPRKKQIASALNSIQNRKHSFRSFGEMQDVLILFNYEDWNEVVDIAKDLMEAGKLVVLWTVKPKKTNKEQMALSEFPSSVEVRVVNRKEISWYSGLSKVVDNEFKNLNYDTLIDLTTYSDKNLFYLLASNTAQFCVGIKEADHKIYDFVVLKEDSKSLSEAYNHLKFYLNNIHKDK